MFPPPLTNNRENRPRPRARTRSMRPCASGAVYPRDHVAWVPAPGTLDDEDRTNDARAARVAQHPQPMNLPATDPEIMR
jgi:hypothetical protein